MDVQWENVLGAIAAVGALGVAAYGVVEAFGKALVWPSGKSGNAIGLPYSGFRTIRALAIDLGSALRLAYGDDYLQILAQQYRDGRGKGRAPETIKQGVRLALPFMSVDEAKTLIDKVWGLGTRNGSALAPGGLDPADALALALVDEKTARFAGVADAAVANEAAATLAGRFSLALDTRIDAAFTIAEQRYQAFARIAAGLMAIALALGFNGWASASMQLPWGVALLIGLVAVPLAPVANDLVSSLSSAARAWQSISRAKT
ncbi:MAG: hypothetical protein ABIO39_07095 [Caulobacteraceae bacterium]